MPPEGHVQVLVKMLDFGMNVQEAGDAARFRHSGSTQSTSVKYGLSNLAPVTV